jgi:hypothetical protein
MRSELEIEATADNMATAERLLRGRTDTFKYGIVVGKLIAIGWALGEPSAGLSIDYDYEDWILEQRSMKGQIPPLDDPKR